MLFRDGVEAENAAKACGAADFLQGRMELGGRVGHEIKEELIDPGRAMNGAAFDFHQIDAVTGKRLERGKERAGFVRKTECDGHF